MNDELAPIAQRPPALAPGLGPAAERFARTTLRKSAQTQRTYASTYVRFTSRLADYTKRDDPPLCAFTAGVLASYDRHDRDPDDRDRRCPRRRTDTRRAGCPELRSGKGSRVREADPQRTDTQCTRDRRPRSRADPCPRRHGNALRRGPLLATSSIHGGRADGVKSWLTVVGNGDKVHMLPTPDVDAARLRWERPRPPELADDPLLFPRLGRRRSDSSYPDAGLPKPRAVGSVG